VVAAGYEAAELKSRAAEDEKVAAEAAYYRSLQRKTLVARYGGRTAVRGRDVHAVAALHSPGGRLYGLIAGLVTLFVLVYSGGHFFRVPGSRSVITTPTWIRSSRSHGRGLGVFNGGGGSAAACTDAAQHAYFEARR